MSFTGNHHAQFKAKMLKVGGHLACRKHNIFAHDEKILGDVEYPYMKTIESMSTFLHPRRTTQSLLEAVTYWRYVP